MVDSPPWRGTRDELISSDEGDCHLAPRSFSDADGADDDLDDQLEDFYARSLADPTEYHLSTDSSHSQLVPCHDLTDISSSSSCNSPSSTQTTHLSLRPPYHDDIVDSDCDSTPLPTPHASSSSSAAAPLHRVSPFSRFLQARQTVQSDGVHQASLDAHRAMLDLLESPSSPHAASPRPSCRSQPSAHELLDDLLVSSGDDSNPHLRLCSQDLRSPLRPSRGGTDDDLLSQEPYLSEDILQPSAPSSSLHSAVAHLIDDLVEDHIEDNDPVDHDESFDHDHDDNENDNDDDVDNEDHDEDKVRAKKVMNPVLLDEIDDDFERSPLKLHLAQATRKRPFSLVSKSLQFLPPPSPLPPSDGIPSSSSSSSSHPTATTVPTSTPPHLAGFAISPLLSSATLSRTDALLRRTHHCLVQQLHHALRPSAPRPSSPDFFDAPPFALTVLLGRRFTDGSVAMLGLDRARRPRVVFFPPYARCTQQQARLSSLQPHATLSLLLVRQLPFALSIGYSLCFLYEALPQGPRVHRHDRLAVVSSMIELDAACKRLLHDNTSLFPVASQKNIAESQIVVESQVVATGSSVTTTTVLRHPLGAGDSLRHSFEGKLLQIRTDPLNDGLAFFIQRSAADDEKSTGGLCTVLIPAVYRGDEQWSGHCGRIGAHISLLNISLHTRILLTSRRNAVFVHELARVLFDHPDIEVRKLTIHPVYIIDFLSASSIQD